MGSGARLSVLLELTGCHPSPPQVAGHRALGAAVKLAEGAVFAGPRRGEIPLVVYEFEDRILRFPRLCVSQDREAVAVATNSQVLRKAAV